MLVGGVLLRHPHVRSRGSGRGKEEKNRRGRSGSSLAALGYQQLYSTGRADGEVFFPPNAMRSSPPKTRSAPKDATASVQDYLAAIYDLHSSGKPVIGARPPKHMGVPAPALTAAIHPLSRTGHVRVGRRQAR